MYTRSHMSYHDKDTQRQLDQLSAELDAIISAFNAQEDIIRAVCYCIVYLAIPTRTEEDTARAIDATSQLTRYLESA